LYLRSKNDNKLPMINKVLYRRVPISEISEVIQGESIKNNLKVVGLKSTKNISYEHSENFYQNLFSPINLNNIHEHRDLFLEFIGPKFNQTDFFQKWGFLYDYKSENFPNYKQGFFKLLNNLKNDKIKKDNITKKSEIDLINFKNINGEKINYEFLFEYTNQWEIERNYLFNLVNVINVIHTNNFKDFFEIIENKFSKQGDDIFLIEVDEENNSKFITFKNLQASINLIRDLEMEVYSNDKNIYQLYKLERNRNDFRIYLDSNNNFKDEFSTDELTLKTINAEPNDDYNEFSFDEIKDEYIEEKSNIFAISQSNLRKKLLDFISKNLNKFRVQTSFEIDLKSGEPIENSIVNNLSTLLGITIKNFYISKTPLKNCKNCGTFFTKSILGGNKDQFFCSNKCRFSMTYKNEQELKSLFEKEKFYILNQPKISFKLKRYLSSSPNIDQKSPLIDQRVPDFIAFQEEYNVSEIINFLVNNDHPKLNTFILLIEHVANLYKYTLSKKIIELVEYYSKKFPEKFIFCLSDNDTFIYIIKNKKLDLIATNKIISSDQLDFLFLDHSKISSTNEKLTNAYKHFYLND